MSQEFAQVVDESHWTVRAAALAATLAANGDLCSPALRRAVCSVPRHLLVPHAFVQDHNSWREIDTSDPEGMDLVYAPHTLISALDRHGDSTVPVSSSTKPDLVVRMLELLRLRDGHKVLEIGTGTGYTAALLAHRLGDDHVVSVDVDPQLVELARHRLAVAGFYPSLHVGDGAEGLAGHGPYDRIIATCSVPAVPWAWAEQTRPSGQILVDVKLAVGAGNLVLLERFPDRLEGRFTARWAGFMSMRHAGDQAGRDASPATDEKVRRTTTPPTPWWDARVVWFLAQFALPAGVVQGMRLSPVTGEPTAVTLHAPDGSWARVDLTARADGSRDLIEAGPTPLWTAVEDAHELWTSLGAPEWSRFGLTATGDRQWVWLDTPIGPHRWGLPDRSTGRR